MVVKGLLILVGSMSLYSVIMLGYALGGGSETFDSSGTANLISLINTLFAGLASFATVYALFFAYNARNQWLQERSIDHTVEVKVCLFEYKRALGSLHSSFEKLVRSTYEIQSNFSHESLYERHLNNEEVIKILLQEEKSSFKKLELSILKLSHYQPQIQDEFEELSLKSQQVSNFIYRFIVSPPPMGTKQQLTMLSKAFLARYSSDWYKDEVTSSFNNIEIQLKKI